MCTVQNHYSDNLIANTLLEEYYLRINDEIPDFVTARPFLNLAASRKHMYFNLID